MKKTGKTRYRQNWRGKMILQIEWTWEEPIDVGYGLGTHSETVTGWRDATWEDVNG